MNGVIDAVIYKKNQITDNYNELNFSFKEGFNVIFRAYNDGIAYRFTTNLKNHFEVENEQAVFNFPDEPKIFCGLCK